MQSDRKEANEKFRKLVNNNFENEIEVNVSYDSCLSKTDNAPCQSSQLQALGKCGKGNSKKRGGSSGKNNRLRADKKYKVYAD